jgi:hypothetical protein
MSPPLPPEVRVTTTPTGARYRLPWKAAPAHFRWRSRVAFAIAVVALALAVYRFLQPPASPRPKGGEPPLGIFLLIASGVALVYASARRFVHCTAEVGAGKLVLSEWQGPFPLRRERPLDRVRAFVVHPLPGTAAEAGAVTATADGVIEVVCAGVQPVWWAHGYPRALLAPLTEELAARCGVPHREAGPDQPPPAPPPFAEQAVRDRDTADVADRPARARAVLERSADGLTLTLPPAGSWGNELAVAIWALALVWGLAPVFIAVMTAREVLRHGPMPSPHWAFVAGFLAIGPAVVLFVYESAGSQTTFRVRGGRLTRLKTSPVFGPERLTWRRDDVLALRTAVSQEGKGKTLAVMLYLADGEPVQLLTGTQQEELGWIATVLRQELGVPALPGQPAEPPVPAPETPPPAAAEEAPRPTPPRPPRLLPAPIRVEGTATGTRYVLPWLWAPRPLWRRIAVGFLLGLAILAAGGCLWSGSLLPDWLRGLWMLRGLGGLALVGFGGLLAAVALSLLLHRHTVEVGPGELRFRWRSGLHVDERPWPVGTVRRLVTRRLPAMPGDPDGEARGWIEVVGDGGKSFSFGLWYPVALLRPLAQELAERLNVPEECAEVEAKVPVPAPVPPAAPAAEAAAEDVADEPAQPAGSRAVVERSAGGLTVTLPPPGCWRDRRARVILPFAVTAGAFVALNGLAAGRVAVVGPAGAAEVASVLAWLLGSAALAALLALWVVRRARGRTTVRADDKGLAVVRSAPLLRPRREEWPRDGMVALRLGPAWPVPHGGKGFALRLHTKDGRAVNVLTGDDEAELRWLATVLREALRVPAAPA